MEADYVIVGAGSAGCAMAWRLPRRASRCWWSNMAAPMPGPFIQMPGALSYPMNMKRYDWGYRTEPEPHLGGRRLACPRGKVIGGSSSINGMVYVRGHAAITTTGATRAATAGASADVLPYFKRMECWHDGGHGGDPAWRGADGPLHVSRGRMENPLTRAFVEAGTAGRLRPTGDYNGEKQEGFGPFEMTVFGGRRWSAANAYLRPALKRPGGATLVRGLVRAW